MILLDTFTFIGVASEPSRLSPGARLHIEDAEARLFVSAITMFELATAAAKGRLTLGVDPRTYFALALARHKIGVLDVTWEVAALSCELPPYHNDPADRFIIATAIIHDLTLLTPDQHIHRYGAARVSW